MPLIFIPVSRLYFKVFLCIVLCFSLTRQLVCQNNYEGKFIAYNALAGAITGGVGAIINKSKDQKWHKAFLKGFVVGSVGGGLAYSGKKLNLLVAQQHNLGYAWLSRAVFSAGNSIVENASANRDFWSQWHYDVGFIRVEVKTKTFSVIPKFMPSVFGGFVFIALNGSRFDAVTSLKSGSVTFRTKQIHYAPNLVASTTTNGFLIVDTLTSGKVFYETFAHEMVHAFQFQEYSGVNYYFNPITDKWKANSPFFKKFSKYVHGDLNYELMLTNYFLIQGGYKGKIYCHNFLENEAEFLTTRRCACGN